MYIPHIYTTYTLHIYIHIYVCVCGCVCVCVYIEREKQSKDKHVEKGEISLGSGGPENIPRIAMTILLLPPPC